MKAYDLYAVGPILFLHVDPNLQTLSFAVFPFRCLHLFSKQTDFVFLALPWPSVHPLGLARPQG